MAYCKTAITPSLMHWSYWSFALGHWYHTANNNNILKSSGYPSGRATNPLPWTPHTYFTPLFFALCNFHNTRIKWSHKHIAVHELNFVSAIHTTIVTTVIIVICHEHYDYHPYGLNFPTPCVDWDAFVDNFKCSKLNEWNQPTIWSFNYNENKMFT